MDRVDLLKTYKVIEIYQQFFEAPRTPTEVNEFVYRHYDRLHSIYSDIFPKYLSVEESESDTLSKQDLDFECEEVFGVNLTQRDGSWDGKDKHVIVEIYAGDDGNYWKVQSFSSFWLPRFIAMLQNVQSTLETDKKRFAVDSKWGFKFK